MASMLHLVEKAQLVDKQTNAQWMRRPSCPFWLAAGLLRAWSMCSFTMSTDCSRPGDDFEGDAVWRRASVLANEASLPLSPLGFNLVQGRGMSHATWATLTFIAILVGLGCSELSHAPIKRLGPTPWWWSKHPDHLLSDCGVLLAAAGEEPTAMRFRTQRTLTALFSPRSRPIAVSAR